MDPVEPSRELVAAPNGKGRLLRAKGYSPNPGGITKERRALIKAIDKNHIPKVLGILDQLYERSQRELASDDKPLIATALYLLQVRGPLKPSDADEAKVDAKVEEKLQRMLDIAEAEATRRAGAIDVLP